MKNENYIYIIWIKDRYDKRKKYRIRKAPNGHYFLRERVANKYETFYESAEVQVTKAFVTDFITDKIFNYAFNGTTLYETMSKFNKEQSDFTFKRMRKADKV